jgi:hypothetical protein
MFEEDEDYEEDPSETFQDEPTEEGWEEMLEDRTCY